MSDLIASVSLLISEWLLVFLTTITSTEQRRHR